MLQWIGEVILVGFIFYGINILHKYGELKKEVRELRVENNHNIDKIYEYERSLKKYELSTPRPIVSDNKFKEEDEGNQFLHCVECDNVLSINLSTVPESNCNVGDSGYKRELILNCDNPECGKEYYLGKIKEPDNFRNERSV